MKRHAFAAVLLAVAVGARVAAARGTLLYPDGYQYLLMARGIDAHLRPVIELGRGGDLFVPSADAAAKPLYPAAIALFHLFGFGWRGAATAVSAVSAGLAVGLSGILVSRLTGSRIAGLAAAALLLVSPATREWSSYAVPDPFAQALAVGAILAVVDRRFRLGGVLAGLAVLVRPEFGLLLLLGAGALAVRGEHRAAALRLLTAGAATTAAVLLVLRPPLDLTPTPWHAALTLAAVLVAIAGVLAPPRMAIAAGVGALAAAGVVAPAVSSLTTGAELPLVLLAAAGLIAIGPIRPRALLATAAGSLALLYAWKNPGSERYAANLLPLAALAAGFAVAAIPRRGLALAAAAAAVCVSAVASAGPVPARDSFTTVAAEVPPTSTPLVSAAADAYGFLLYPRPVRWLRPGARGIVLVDGAARAYEPGQIVRGRVVARLGVGAGFLRPDGRIDRRPALLVAR